MTNLSDIINNSPRRRVGAESVANRRVGSALDVERQLERVRLRPSSGAVDPEVFADVLATEFDRLRHGGSDSVLAILSFAEVDSIRRRLGDNCVFDLITELTKVVGETLTSHDLYNVSEDGEIVVLARDRRLAHATKRIDTLCAAISARRFRACDETVSLTPAAGATPLSNGSCPADVLSRAKQARFAATIRIDRQPEPRKPHVLDEPVGAPLDLRQRATALIPRRLRFPLLVLAMFVVGLVIPILAYRRFDIAVGFGRPDGVWLGLAAAIVLAVVMAAVGLGSVTRRRTDRQIDANPDNERRDDAADVAVADVADAVGVADLGDAPEPSETFAELVEPVAGAACEQSRAHLETASETARVVDDLNQRCPSSASEVLLPRRAPGASLDRPKKTPPISEHARLALRPGQYRGVLDPSIPEVFVREYERTTRHTLAALEGVRRSLDTASSFLSGDSPR